MARLIDADKRIAEIKKYYCTVCENYGGAKCRACWVDDAMCLIDGARSVDAGPGVRCRDCEHRCNGKDCTHPLLLSYSFGAIRNVKDNDFCSYGERKDGDGND